MRRFYVPPEKRDQTVARIDGPDARHMASVLRLAVGQEVVVFDGLGMEHAAVISDISPKLVILDLGDRYPSKSESPLSVTVAQGFLKESKMDTLLRPLTELGGNRWVPFFSERTVPRPKADKLERRIQRWRKICAESLKQCGRSRFPEVMAPVNYSSVLEMMPKHDAVLFFWEAFSDGDTGLPDLPEPPESVLIVIGPEGGFTENEAEQARSAGAHIVGMGPRILKADTAVLAAITMVQVKYGDMG